MSEDGPYSERPGRRRLVDAIPPGGMEPDRLRSVAQGLIETLARLHGAGRVHGAIGPGCLWLIDSDNGEEIELGAPTTGEGSEFASPELASGEPPSVSSDIYSVASALYLAVSGRVPAGVAARLAAAEASAPDPLGDISADRTLQDRHGLAFLDAVMAGLELRPMDRPASLSEWRSALFGQPVRQDSRPILPPRTVERSSPRPAEPERKAPPVSDQPPPTWMRDAYEPEPERTPWGRWIAAGILLAGIASAGVWLAVTTRGGAPAEPGPSIAETEAPAEAPPPVSSDNEAWVRALEQDTLEGYRAYLEAFPNGRHAADAQAEIDRYDDEAWAEAERRNTLAGYEAYLEAWPDGRHASQARERAEAIRSVQEAAAADAAERAAAEAADWERAARADTVQSYTEYLGKHPAGRNAAEARARRDRLQAAAADRAAFQQAEALNTVRAYEQYLAQFPQGAFQMQAVAAIDALKPAAGRTFRDCPTCPLMVTLPAGTAQLGARESDSEASPSEKPQRPVTFSGFFAISETEVTFDAWQACVAAGACSPVAGDNGWGRGSRPVINVTWNDASAYAAWLSQETGQSYSLPSEAQWEYAARGGDTGSLPGGSAAAVCAVANGAARESGLAWANGACADPAPDRTLPAGSLIANRFGVKDMIGNVAEWTLDCNTLNLRDAPVDGGPDLRGSCNQRAVRGGSWFSGTKDLRFTARLMLRRGDSNDFTGFRVVREVN